MNIFKIKRLSALLVLTTLSISFPAIAETKFDIINETQSVTDKQLTSGLIKVLASYTPFNQSDEDNLKFKIYYNGKLGINSAVSTSNTGSIFLQDLDNNKTPEVIIETFSGGAHCCSSYIIYTRINNKFIKYETGLLDGGGKFEDLDKDGKYEFITRDNSFLYQFSSYAGSFAPTVIYGFRKGKLVDVTLNHAKQLKQTAWEMYKAFLDSKKENYEVNGILAGYVAQKAQLGEFQAAWKFMLANYDRNSDTGLAIYNGDREVGKYANFPTALRAFLIQQGYLDKQGKPKR